MKFQQNLGDIIVAVLIGFVIFVAIFAVGWFLSFISLRGAADSVSCRTDFQGVTRCDTSGGGFFWFWLALAVQFLIFWIGSFLLQVIIIRASLAITYGQKIETKNLLSTENLGQYMLASIIVAVLGMVGFFLCIIPAFIVFFFSQFFGYFIVDKEMGAMDAIKASMQLVNKNIGTLVGFFIACYIAMGSARAACGIGLIVAWPVVIIATGYMYKRLQGEPVAGIAEADREGRRGGGRDWHEAVRTGAHQDVEPIRPIEELMAEQPTGGLVWQGERQGDPTHPGLYILTDVAMNVYGSPSKPPTESFPLWTISKAEARINAGQALRGVGDVALTIAYLRLRGPGDAGAPRAFRKPIEPRR